MSYSDSVRKRIVFRLSGEPLHKVTIWQREVDLLVFRYQLETQGYAMVTRHREMLPLQRLTEVPKPGEAIPYYGTFSEAYVFTFRPYAHGYRLKAENIRGGMARFYPSELPSLELDIPEPIQIEASTSETLWSGPAWGWWYHPTGELVCDEIAFAIDGEMYGRLVQWGWDHNRVDRYAYQFRPLSVGCEIFVRDTITGEEEHLTKDVCW